MPLDDRRVAAAAVARGAAALFRLLAALLLRPPVGLADLQLPHGVALLHQGQDPLDQGAAAAERGLVEEARFFFAVAVVAAVVVVGSVVVVVVVSDLAIIERRRKIFGERLALEAVPSGRSPVGGGRHRVALGAPRRDGLPNHLGGDARGRRRRWMLIRCTVTSMTSKTTRR